MAKKSATGGAANLKAVLDNKSSLANLSDDQLGALGGTRDSIDSEDFSEADFGNEVTESPSDDEPSDEDTDESADKGDDVDESEESDEKDEPVEDADESEDEPEEGQDTEDEPEEGQDEDEPAGDKDEPADDESDAGDDAEDQAEDEPEEDADEEEPDTDQRVPLKRFRDVNRKMREAQARADELERRMAALEGKQPGEDGEEDTPYDFDAAEERYQDLLLDGQKKEAAALRKEIRAAEQATYIKAADAIGGRNAEASHAKRGLDALAAQYEKDYPAMDSNSDDFDPEVNMEVQALMVGYMDQGTDPVKAFEKALKQTVKLYDLKPVAAAKGGKPAAKGGEKGKDGGKDGKGKAKPQKPTEEQLKQKKKAGKDKAAKAKKAPPDTTQVGDPGDGGKGGKKVIDIETMSEEDFNALPKSTLARLRGDIL